MKTAICDTKTGKITGCKKGSSEYEHEKKHLEFSQSELGMKIQYFAQLSEFYTIIFLTLSFFINFFKWFAGLGAILMIFFFTFEEIYCNK